MHRLDTDGAVPYTLESALLLSGGIRALEAASGAKATLRIAKSSARVLEETKTDAGGHRESEERRRWGRERQMPEGGEVEMGSQPGCRLAMSGRTRGSISTLGNRNRGVEIDRRRRSK